ncbi:MAG: hypothetical protein GVY22_05020 [Gammaproteobacteria bacterium]|nr:hypothetical protein [Gammaproteobacteria bacterium]
MFSTTVLNDNPEVMMTLNAVATHTGREPWRPNLAPLYSLITLSCLLSGYFLVDTYFFREPTPKYADNGTTFILRLRAPLDSSLPIKHGGDRLIQAISTVKQQSEELKADIAARLSEEERYQSALAAFMEQLDDAERMIAALKVEVASLQHEQSNVRRLAQ